MKTKNREIGRAGRLLSRLAVLGCMLGILGVVITTPAEATDCFTEYQTCDDACYPDVYLSCLAEPGFTPEICYYAYNQCRMGCQAVLYDCLGY